MQFCVNGRPYLIRGFFNTSPLVDFATFFCKICDSSEIPDTIQLAAGSGHLLKFSNRI